jgi:hypothetical protein
MDPVGAMMHPLAGMWFPELAERPCLHCAHREGEAGCEELARGLTPGWPRNGGRLPEGHLLPGQRCPRWAEARGESLP